MKKYIFTLVSLLVSLTISAQSLLNIYCGSEPDKYLYVKDAVIEFWGLPGDGEINSDLTAKIPRVYSNNIGIELGITATNFMEDYGFYISTEKNEQKEYENVIRPQYYQTPIYTVDSHYFSLQSYNSMYVVLEGLEAGTTYYVKPYVVTSGEMLFGSEKAVTTKNTVQSILADKDLYGDWYESFDGMDPVANTNMYIFPTASAWEAVYNKYKAAIGLDLTPELKNYLVGSWFSHLTAAEADMMKQHSVKYYDVMGGYSAYTVDQVCADLMPKLLASSGSVNLMKIYEDDSRNNIIPQLVTCDESFGIVNNQYVRIDPLTSGQNPRAAYILPLSLWPNKTYKLSVTIAANTEDIENAAPNRFYLYLSGNRFHNPDTSEEHGSGNVFIYGGKQTETFTLQFSTEVIKSGILEFRSTVTSTQSQNNQYSRTMRIARVYVEEEGKEIFVGDADRDGIVNDDDLLTVASTILVNNETTETQDESAPPTDYTGDGKTMIDDIVALVNYIIRGEFVPTSSKLRAKAAAGNPSFISAEEIVVNDFEPTTLSINMSGLSGFSAFSFDIQVPEGIYVSTDADGKPLVTIGDVTKTTHSVSTAMQADGRTISVVCYSSSNDLLAKDSGTMINLGLMANGDLTYADNPQIVLSNAMLTRPNVTSVMLDDYTMDFKITTDVQQPSSANTLVEPVTYYSINGSRLAAPQKGVNLMRMSDGTWKKIFVK